MSYGTDSGPGWYNGRFVYRWLTDSSFFNENKNAHDVKLSANIPSQKLDQGSVKRKGKSGADPLLSRTSITCGMPCRMFVRDELS